MARRGWARPIPVAILSSAATAAAQLGLGYGLGIIEWNAADLGQQADAAIAAGVFPAGLAWATWVCATSVVVGAIIGDRVRGPVTSGTFVRAAGRIVLSFAATLGALIAIPLVALPAMDAPIDDNYAPHLLATVYAAAGAVLGLVVSMFATLSRAIAANILVSMAWLWALAVIAIADGRLSGRSIGYAQLAVWKFTDSGPVWSSFYIPGALLMIGTALLVGGLTAFAAAGRTDGRFGVAISGAMGPLLVAAAYILAAPSLGSAPDEQISAYRTAPYMVLAGLVGSMLVTAVSGGFTSPKRRTAGNRAVETTAHTEPAS